MAWRFVYPVCIVWDYACQGTVNKDSVHLLHTVLDPAAKSVHEWEHVWISHLFRAWRHISPVCHRSSEDLVLFGFLGWNLQSQVCFLHANGVFDFLNRVSLRHEIAVSCGHVLLHLENSPNLSVPLMIIHIQSSFGGNNERSLLGAVHGHRVISLCVCFSFTLQWLNLIKSVLTTLQYSKRFLHIDTITPLLWASTRCPPPPLRQHHADSVLMTNFPWWLLPCDTMATGLWQQQRLKNCCLRPNNLEPTTSTLCGKGLVIKRGIRRGFGGRAELEMIKRWICVLNYLEIM